MTQTSAQTAMRQRSRFVGLYYVFTIFTGVFVLFFHGRLALAADLFATVFFLVLTIFFYDLSKPATGRKGR